MPKHTSSTEIYIISFILAIFFFFTQVFASGLTLKSDKNSPHSPAISPVSQFILVL